MSEVVIVGVLFLIVVAASTFYLYSRLLYSERKLGLMENLLLDIKMSMEMEREIHHTGDVEKKPDILEPTFTDAPKDDTEYYASTIENAVIEAEEINAVPAPTGPSEAVVNYDSLSRDELVAVAEKKGLRVTKRATKQQLLTLLRDASKNTSGLPETGTDAPVGGATGSMEGASLVSGESQDQLAEGVSN
jgi:Tfp pilus assembly protein PilE